MSTLRRGARMLVNWPVNQIGLSLEPDKGSIIYLRQKKKSKRNVIIFLFSRACGDEEDCDDYWILTVFYYTLYPQRNCGELVRVLWLPAKFIHSTSLSEHRAAVLLASVVFVFLWEQLGRMRDRDCEKSSWRRTIMCSWFPTGTPWKQERSSWCTQMDVIRDPGCV